MNELVDALTKPKFANKLVTILAGYDADINKLMNINPGLTSRFPEAIVFRNLTDEECFQLLIQTLNEKKVKTNLVSELAGSELLEILGRFKDLSGLPAWGNARDIQTVAKSIYGHLMRSTHSSQVELEADLPLVLQHMDNMISERQHRAQAVVSRHQPQFPVAPPLTQSPPPTSSPSMKSTASTNKASTVSTTPDEPCESSESDSDDDDSRVQLPVKDAGVSDSIWTALQQADTNAQARDKQQQEEFVQKQDDLTTLTNKIESEAKKITRYTPLGSDDSDTESNNKAKIEHQKRAEEARRRLELERLRRAQMIAAMEQAKLRYEEEKKKEEKAQRKLRELGVCVQGYRWIKIPGGYRCAGGAHWVSDNMLGI